jgi:Zn-dependent peptidase ImmA (M78 family)
MIKVKVNPDVLKWAREEAGCNVIEVSEKFSIDYQIWEQSKIEIPLDKLREVADYYKRQVAVFFLSKVPDKINKPKDFRNLRADSDQLSKEILLVLRRSHSLQQLAKNLMGEEYWKKKNESIYGIRSLISEFELDHKNITNKVRNILKIEPDQQLSWINSSIAYREWRLAIEERFGVLVFQFPMPENEIQGFCLTDSLPNVIVVNSRNHYNCRIFSALHELAHIIREQAGLCIMDYSNTKSTMNDEFASNSFAGKVLVPDSMLQFSDNLDEIHSLSKKLKVSSEVYLRRLKETSLITETKFYEILNHLRVIQQEYNIIKKTPSGGPSPLLISKARSGSTLFGIVINAVHSDRLGLIEASRALGLKVGTLTNEIS